MKKRMSTKAAAGVVVAAAMMVSLGAAALAWAEEPAAEAFENNGYVLSVPEEYKDLVLVDTEDNEKGMLFSVYERASVEAAEAQGETHKGAGELFRIGTVSEERVHDLLCGDMSGIDVFALDEDNQYFIYYHPTDVRFVRESYDDIEEDQKQWTELNEWAYTTVRDRFIEENEGLSSKTFGNSSADMVLARIAYKGDVNYTISTTEFGPLEPKDVDPLPYVERLIGSVSSKYLDKSETPDGEYVVLNVPDENQRFDFFKGKANYFRCVHGDDGEYEELFEISYADDSVNATEIMQEWYDALAKANGK